MTSYSPGDIEHGYCGNCHAYTSGPLLDPDDRPLRPGEFQAMIASMFGGQPTDGSVDDDG